MLVFLSRWIDAVATGLTRLNAMLRRGRRIELTEQADGSFRAAVWRKGTAVSLDEPLLRLEQDRFAVGIVRAIFRTVFGCGSFRPWATRSDISTARQRSFVWS